LPIVVGDARPQAAPPNRVQFTAATLLVGITLLCVFFALFVAAPGLAILLAIFAFPAFVRTAMVARRREELGRPMSSETKFVSFIGSMAAAALIAMVVVVASIGTFCTICLTSGREEMIPVAALIAGGVTIPIVVALGKWVRNRYRRDTEGRS
jgi:hypothetical protein